MRSRAILLVAMGIALIVVFAGCGGGSSPQGGDETTASSGGATTAASGTPYNVSPTMASLQEAGWQATETEGIPDTYTGVQQVGYLETTAPDGEAIDLQFFENSSDAERELNRTQKKESPFEGTTIGNVMVFDPQTDTAVVSQENLDALKQLLQ